MIDMYQPLDRRVFEVLKAYAKTLVPRQIDRNPDVKRFKGKAVQGLIAAWDGLRDIVIEEAWDIYSPLPG
jgi:hypothetical protein